MRKTVRAIASCSLAAAASQSVLAADAAPDRKSATPSLGEIIAASGITMNGYIDTAYSYLNSTGSFSSGVPSRVFDTEPSSFNLHQTAFIAAYQPKEGFGGLVNLTAGRDARVIKAFDTTTDDFDVTQAFVQYAHRRLTIIAGKYVTLVGAEVINPTANVNYSRSILFGYATPYTHTGVRLAYSLNDQLNLIVGLNNGWDQLKDANKQKTVEAGLSYTPVKAFILSVQGYTGTEHVAGFTDTVQGRRNLLDVVATYNATRQLGFVLNYDYGDQDNVTSLVDGTRIKAKWSGVAAYVNYAFSDQWRISLRGEYFDDSDGYRTGVIQKWQEGTITVAYLPTTHAEVRGESRWDRSDNHTFAQSDGSAKRDQGSLSVEVILKF